MRLRPAQRRVLTLDLLLASVVLALLVLHTSSLAILASGYLFWQMFHYSRQSDGIHKVLLRHTAEPFRSPTVTAAMYAAAWFCFLTGLSEAGGQFLGLPILVLPEVTPTLVAPTAVCALLFLGWNVWSEARAKRSFSSTHLGGHLATLGFAYCFLPSLEQAWLVSNVWHNTQYLLIVRNSIADTLPRGGLHWARSLTLQASGLPFLSICVLGGVALYGLLRLLGTTAVAQAPEALMALYIGVNFHHYIIDGLIWKRRSRLLDALG
jgi:hypothetical protein